MRIAVFIESPPTFAGPFNQSVSVAEALSRCSDNHEVIFFTHIDSTYRELTARGMEVVRFSHRGVRLLDRWSATELGYAVLRRLRGLGLRRLGRHLDALLQEHRIDLAFFNNLESDVVERIGDHPFIVAVWDIDQRDYPEFPEAFRDRGFQRVTRSHGVTLTRALAVVVNAASMGRRLNQLYGVDVHRILELPFLPSAAVRRHKAGQGSSTVESVTAKYDLRKPYVFFPAFLTHHKNALYLLDALVDLKSRHGLELDAVFCGGGTDEALDLLERQSRSLGLEDRVRTLGYVPDSDVPPLYEAALATVVPSYFGPINLPQLEAISLGSPLVCSDLEACREQFEDAALYCDLERPSNLADHLAALLQDEQVSKRLKRAAGRVSKKFEPVHYYASFARVLDSYEYIRRRWSWLREGS